MNHLFPCKCGHKMSSHEHHSARRSRGWYQCLYCTCQSGKSMDNLEYLEWKANDR